MKKIIRIVAASFLAVSCCLAAEKSLNVVVKGTISPQPVVFTGSFVYVKEGKEIKKELNGKGNQSEAFRGDYIKSCTVQKTSEKGEMQLVIMEDGQKIYQSPRTSTNGPIVYVKK